MNTKSLTTMTDAIGREITRVEGRLRLTEARHEALVELAEAAEHDASTGALTEAQADRVMDLVPISRKLVDRLEERVRALRQALRSLVEARELAATARSDRKANERKKPRALPELLRGYR